MSIDIKTLGASDISYTNMDFNGEVVDMGQHDLLLAWFEYGTDPDLSDAQIGPCTFVTEPMQFSFHQGELQDNEQYNFRMVAENLEDTADQAQLIDSSYGFDLIDGTTDSETAMDGITDSEAAMDIITDKEMPMDKVMADVMPRTKMLLSPYVIDTMWSKEMASEKFWDIVYKTTNVGDVGYYELINNSTNGYGLNITYDYENNNDENYNYWEVELDFSNVETLEIEFGVESNASRPDIIISVGSNELYSNLEDADDDNPVWTTRSFDVGSITGVKTLKLETGVSHSSSNDGLIEAKTSYIKLS